MLGLSLRIKQDLEAFPENALKKGGGK